MFVQQDTTKYIYAAAEITAVIIDCFNINIFHARKLLSLIVVAFMICCICMCMKNNNYTKTNENVTNSAIAKQQTIDSSQQTKKMLFSNALMGIYSRKFCWYTEISYIWSACNSSDHWIIIIYGVFRKRLEIDTYKCT